MEPGIDAADESARLMRIESGPDGPIYHVETRDGKRIRIHMPGLPSVPELAAFNDPPAGQPLAETTNPAAPRSAPWPPPFERKEVPPAGLPRPG